MYPNKTVKISQIVIYPLMHLFFKTFFKTKLEIELDLKKGEHYIFAPNHPWRMDPFLIFYLMPFRKLIKIMPLRFMTAKKYMVNPISRFFLSLLGCYEINENVLKESVDLLKNNSSLCIFIQGRIDKDYSEKSKVGAIYINKKFKNSQIVPVKINIDKNLNIFNILFRRINIDIKFMREFIPKQFTKDLQPLADKLLNKIKNG